MAGRGRSVVSNGAGGPSRRAPAAWATMRLLLTLLLASVPLSAQPDRPNCRGVLQATLSSGNEHPHLHACAEQIVPELAATIRASSTERKAPDQTDHLKRLLSETCAQVLYIFHEPGGRWVDNGTLETAASELLKLAEPLSESDSAPLMVRRFAWCVVLSVGVDNEPSDAIPDWPDEEPRSPL